jgi:hypothetical protein
MPRSERSLPRYPIFVPSKGRSAGTGGYVTANFLARDGVPFRLVVEPQEEKLYRQSFPDAEILVLPFSNLGLGSIPARNWIREKAVEEGFDRHWQLDDNIRDIRRLYRGKRIPCNSGVALRVCEDFTDRYTNVGVSGLNYQMFVLDETAVPYYLNCHVYSCCLINHATGFGWRDRYNEDTDLCLRSLAAGWTTIALNIFMATKEQTMISGGGNSDELYKDDGRLRMARSLERRWPRVVTTKRRFNRPQHVIRGAWAGFDTPLIRRTDIDWGAIPPVDEYGLDLIQVAEEIRSPVMRGIYDGWRETNP